MTVRKHVTCNAKSGPPEDLASSVCTMNVVATLSKIAAATFEGSWHNVRYLAVRQTLPWLGLPAWRTTPSTCVRRHSSTSTPTRASVQVFDGASRKPLFTYENRSIPSLKTGEMLVQVRAAMLTLHAAETCTDVSLRVTDEARHHMWLRSSHNQRGSHRTNTAGPRARRCWHGNRHEWCA